MTLAEKAVALAAEEIARPVREDPPGSNRGERIDLYLRTVGLDPTQGAYPWCAAAVSWCVYEAEREVGGPARFRGSAGALALVALNPGLVLAAPEHPCVGVMDHGGGKGHAFFVLSPEGTDAVRTAEGNTDAGGSRTGGQFMYRVRKLSEILHYLRIA